MVLAPSQFGTAAERDAFYARRADEVRRNFEERIATTRRSCTPSAPAVCADAVKPLEAQREDELRQVEQLRLAAPVPTT
ncbi:hypothetical protein JYK14_09815 [Siccirubricoccus sp. KC 17139]|uniref:Uncharacterized protein n=1 Tax=Siccirubricoccus soli TaxID=2899147 RepID=A0ABT1D4B2_9PROT|nr:hypothetical protein [Siccirubricoccus soli]MCO6416462.1 hypothetical protein [Siccirubricoccus soli]MCP2682596.1 hypothetical protein [Siccirubricoccus soli]